jgi:hypothetical protein
VSDPTDRAPTNRRFRRADHDIEIEEGPDHVSLSIDGYPVEVEVVDGRLHSHLAHPILAFDDVDALVERLLANENSTWRMAKRHAPAPHHDDDHGGGGS